MILRRVSHARPRILSKKGKAYYTQTSGTFESELQRLTASLSRGRSVRKYGNIYYILTPFIYCPREIIYMYLIIITSIVCIICTYIYTYPYLNNIYIYIYIYMYIYSSIIISHLAWLLVILLELIIPPVHILKRATRWQMRFLTWARCALSRWRASNKRRTLSLGSAPCP